MDILLISPLGFPVNPQTRYAGIEHLVYEFAKELSNLGHQVSVLGHSKSQFPDKVILYPTDPIGLETYVESEIRQYQSYQLTLRTFDVIHDFSHQHFASRMTPNLPSLNIFWHDPSEVQYPKSPYNIIGPSRWACLMFKKYYHQEARFQNSIALDTNIYKPSSLPRTDRFLTLGVMLPQKGNLEAAKLCKDIGVKLDICGSPTNQEYTAEVRNYVDGKQIQYHGEVSEEKKIHLMQTCRALIYYIQSPEVTSHKVQEAMLCGAPIITGRMGALPEIVQHGKNGFLCRDEKEYRQAINLVGGLVPTLYLTDVISNYSAYNVVVDYLSLYEKVDGGLRW